TCPLVTSVTVVTPKERSGGGPPRGGEGPGPTGSAGPMGKSVSPPAARICPCAKDHPPGASRSDQVGLAGPGTRICGVVVNHHGSAMPQSSALQLHAPDPAP